MPEYGVLLSRILIPSTGLVILALYYLDARLAYGMPKSGKKAAIQFSLVVITVGLFIFQVNVMERLSPADAHGVYFHCFVFIEGGSALAVLFATLIRERARGMRIRTGPSAVQKN